MKLRYLLLGAGRSRERRIDPRAVLGSLQTRQDFSDGELVTVDTVRACGPDLVMDLDAPRWVVRDTPADISPRVRPLLRTVPFHGLELEEGAFDEVHAYEVLEHLGQQGHAGSFFDTFRNIWRLLAPEGMLCASVPSILSPWLWGDPGHRRVITAGTLSFLDRTNPCAPPSSDYRAYLDFDFSQVWAFDDGSNLWFILRAVKPARPFP